MPRQQKRIPRKTFRRKCNNCGKMATNPYVYHIVPSHKYPYNVPVYSKPKTKRVDLKGDMKVAVYNYCDKECYKDFKEIHG